LDVIFGYPHFEEAKKITKQYLNYPVMKWQKLFKEVYETLNKTDDKLSIDLQKYTTIPHISASLQG